MAAAAQPLGGYTLGLASRPRPFRNSPSSRVVWRDGTTLRYRIGRMTTLAVFAFAAASHAAEPTSQACARWEDNYRDLVLQTSALLAISAFALAWLLPVLMSATGKAWRF